MPPTRREVHRPPSSPCSRGLFALSLFCFFNRSHGPLTVTDPKEQNQSLRDVKIHVWKWSCALTSRLGVVLGRYGVDPDRGVRLFNDNFLQSRTSALWSLDSK